MTREWTMASSDGGLVPAGEGRPHPRFYGAFPRRIARYVREREVLTLAEAVRGMTSLPATVFRMHDRGQIAAGRIADLLVVDIEEFGDAATYENPHALAEGIVHAAGGRSVRDREWRGDRGARRPGAEPALDGRGMNRVCAGPPPGAALPFAPQEGEPSES